MSWDRYAIGVVFLAGIWVLPAAGVAVGVILGRRHRQNTRKATQ